MLKSMLSAIALRPRLRSLLGPLLGSSLLGSLVVGLLPLGTEPALGQRFTGLQFCTSSDTPRQADIYVAVAYKVRDQVSGVEVEDWVSKGWWKIPRETSYGCVTVIPEELENRYYYYYAQGLGRTWGGNYRFCMNPLQVYSTDQADINCEASGLALRGFRQIDTQGDRGYRVQIY